MQNQKVKDDPFNVKYSLLLCIQIFVRQLKIVDSLTNLIRPLVCTSPETDWQREEVCLDFDEGSLRCMKLRIEPADELSFYHQDYVHYTNKHF